MKISWRVPNPPGANPLVAERAFPTSDYWGRTGVARRAEEMTGVCTRLRRPPRGPFSYQGVSTRGVRHSLSGPVLRDTARLSQRYPPIARYGVFGVSTWQIGCDTPSPFSERFPLESMRSGGAIPPPSKGVSQRYWRDTL